MTLLLQAAIWSLWPTVMHSALLPITRSSASVSLCPPRVAPRGLARCLRGCPRASRMILSAFAQELIPPLLRISRSTSLWVSAHSPQPALTSAGDSLLVLVVHLPGSISHKKFHLSLPFHSHDLHCCRLMHSTLRRAFLSVCLIWWFACREMPVGPGRRHFFHQARPFQLDMRRFRELLPLIRVPRLTCASCGWLLNGPRLISNTGQFSLRVPRRLTRLVRARRAMLLRSGRHPRAFRAAHLPIHLATISGFV